MITVKLRLETTVNTLGPGCNMTNNGHEMQTASGGALAVGAAHEAALEMQKDSTSTDAARQNSRAIWHLGRLMAGATDADVQLIGAAFADLPLNGSAVASRKAAREYLGARKELLAQVLAQDLDAVPQAAAAALAPTGDRPGACDHEPVPARLAPAALPPK